MKDQQEFLRDLSSAEFRDFVACAQKVMSAAPLKRKQYVLAASNQSEMRQRFDEVALDNRAALKQRITRECACTELSRPAAPPSKIAGDALTSQSPWRTGSGPSRPFSSFGAGLAFADASAALAARLGLGARALAGFANAPLHRLRA